MAGYDDAIATLTQHRLAQLRRSLGGRFGKAPPALVEEALQDVLVEACDPERQRWFVDGFEEGGEEELFRRVYTAGWRRIRGELRRVSVQRTHRMPTDFDASAPDAPASEGAEAAELADWMESRVGEAAERFGRARSQTLQAALNSLVRAGHVVKPLAERYELPRRYLAEASVWLRRQLEDRNRS